MNIQDQKDQLDTRQKRIDISAKIDESRSKRIQYAQESQKRELENSKLKLEIKDKRKSLNKSDDRVFDLICAIQTHIVDNEGTIIGSEPKIKNIWSEDELDLLKNKLLALLKVKC